MKLMIGFALVACLLVAGCGRSSPTDTPTPTATPTREATAEATPTTRPDATATAESPAESGTTATATPVPAPPVSIDMVSTTLEVKPGQEFRVDVVVDPHGGGISGVQVQIEFYPAVLQAAGVQAGTLLGPDPAGPFAQELEQGVFQYLAARKGPTQAPTSPAAFATMNFLVRDAAPAGRETTLELTQPKILDEQLQVIEEVAIGDKLSVRIVP